MNDFFYDTAAVQTPRPFSFAKESYPGVLSISSSFSLFILFAFISSKPPPCKPEQPRLKSEFALLSVLALLPALPIAQFLFFIFVLPWMYKRMCVCVTECGRVCELLTEWICVYYIPIPPACWLLLLHYTTTYPHFPCMARRLLADQRARVESVEKGNGTAQLRKELEQTKKALAKANAVPYIHTTIFQYPTCVHHVSE